MKYNLNPELKNVTHIHQKHIHKIILPLASLYMRNAYKIMNGIEDISYERINLSNHRIFVIIPKNLNGNSYPCNINFHGGAFVYRGWKYQFMLAIEYARRCNSVVVFTDYRLAYKGEYQDSLKDCLDTYTWLLKHTEEYHIDKNHISLSGDSAGGYLALETYSYVMKNMEIKPCGLLLIYPVVDCMMETKSMKTYVDTPVWCSTANKDMWRIYLKDNKEESYLKRDISYLNHVYIETAEFDCLHDEGNLLYERLKNKDVILNETKGTCHGYDMDLSLDIVKDAIEKRCAFLNKMNAQE